ncbi:MAG: hypothetical protein FJY95_19925 [Candidatus Handelsmanbacteria bacterium]|nr:hypothetical protein [Candidatus Handelsmanbacteria bacterium]
MHLRQVLLPYQDPGLPTLVLGQFEQGFAGLEVVVGAPLQPPRPLSTVPASGVRIGAWSRRPASRARSWASFSRVWTRVSSSGRPAFRPFRRCRARDTSYCRWASSARA